MTRQEEADEVIKQFHYEQHNDGITSGKCTEYVDKYFKPKDPLLELTRKMFEFDGGLEETHEYAKKIGVFTVGMDEAIQLFDTKQVTFLTVEVWKKLKEIKERLQL